MWPAPRTATDYYTKKYINTGETIKLTDKDLTAGTADPYLTGKNQVFVSDFGSGYMSGATIISQEHSPRSNVIRLTNKSNFQSILAGITNKQQSGTKLLELIGVFEGESDMSTDKKKYLNE